MKLIPNLRNLTTPAKLLDFFVERTGMIREPTTASIDFAHRTFQEYLSAVYAVHNDEIGMLTRLATDTQWREVIILAAGLANQKQRQELIATILLRGDEEEDNRHQLHMLAIACLETLTGIEPDLHSEIIRNLEELIPPQNLEEAKALATAGDLAVPHLRKNGRSFSRYNINALEAIKSQVSVQALFDYIEDANTELANQLLQTFNRLYQDEVGRKLLSGLRIPEWKINKPRLFPFLHHFGNVGKLTIQHYPHPDFPDITHLKDTKELILIDCPSIKSPEVFKSLTGLEKIAIINCSSFTELRGISSFRELRELELRNVPVDNLTPFGRLSELSRLSITKLNIKDLPEMLTVPLKRLEIKKCKELTGIENLRFYSEVRTLVLEECPNIFDLNGNLLKMRRLRKLDLITSDSKPIYRISEALRNKVNVVERKP